MAGELGFERTGKPWNICDFAYINGIWLRVSCILGNDEVNMTEPNYNNFEGMNLYDKNGEKIGTFEDLYLDGESEQPKWATVSSGLFGLKQHYVPLSGVTRHEDGYKTPYAKEAILSAPSIDADEYLAADEEERLYTHYSMDEVSDRVAAGQTDDAGMTRSDQALREDRKQHELGRMPLRKYVVISKTQVAVPMGEVADTELSADADQATAGLTLSKDEQEAVLRSEQSTTSQNTRSQERAKTSRNNTQRQQPAFGEVQNETATDRRAGSHKADIDGEDQ
jgi:hypothetical protein